MTMTSEELYIAKALGQYNGTLPAPNTRIEKLISQLTTTVSGMSTGLDHVEVDEATRTLKFFWLNGTSNLSTASLVKAENKTAGYYY